MHLIDEKIEYLKNKCIKKHDSCEGVSVDGYITTGVCALNIPSFLEPVLQNVVKEVFQSGSNASLYVYGSAATGLAQKSTSDLDLIAVNIPPDKAALVSEKLSKKYSALCRDVSLAVTSECEYEKADSQSYGNRVFLTHYAALVKGPDMRLTWPYFENKYLADAAAAKGFNGDIELVRQSWILHASKESASANLAKRIGRKSLVTLAGLLSIKNKSWSTNRLAAARQFAAEHPSLAKDLAQLVWWAYQKDAKVCSSELHGILNGFVRELSEEFNNQIGLW